MAWDVKGLVDATRAEPPPRFTVAFLRPLALALGRCGVDGAAFLAGLGVPEGARDGFAPVIPVLEALEEIAARIRSPHLGIDLVRNLPLGAFGLADYRFSASAILGEALTSFRPSRPDFVESIRYELAIEDDVAHIEMLPLFAFPRNYPIGEGFAMAIVVRRLRDVMGDAAVKLTAARFVYPAPASTRIFDEFFGVPVQFGAASYDIAFARDLLEAPLLTANADLARVLAERAPAPGARAPDADPFLDRVRAAVAAALAVEPPAVSISDVSGRLGLTPRSLQRRLQEKHVSFSSFVDEARRALAQDLLSREGTLLCDVAYRLGFNSVTAFFRAFRRWTGASPRQFQRERLRAGGR